MFTREAQWRFFFYLNSFGFLLLCLFVTPTSAHAPQPLAFAGPTHSAEKDTSEKNETKSARSASDRKQVQASREDAVRSVARDGRVKISEREMELLARLVYAEGRGEPYEGQVAIAAVVLNRVASHGFPNTVREVIYAPNAFSPVHDGNLTSKMNDTARKAVRDAVAGQDPTNGSLYFFNPNTATSSWIWSRTQTVTIANHVFAK